MRPGTAAGAATTTWSLSRGCERGGLEAAFANGKEGAENHAESEIREGGDETAFYKN